MSTEANKKIVMGFFDAMAAGDGDGAMALLAPGATWWIPTDQPDGMAMAKEVMAAGVNAFLTIFSRPPRFELISMTAEDDRVALEQRSRDGLTHGGNSYGNDYHMFFRLRDGLIVEVKEYMNPMLAGAITAEIEGKAG